MEKKSMAISFSIGLLSAILVLFSTLFLGEVFLTSVLAAILPVLLARTVFGKAFLEHIEKYYTASVLLQIVTLGSVRFYPRVYQDIILQALKAFTDIESGSGASVAILTTSFKIPILTLIVGILLISYRERLQDIVLEKL
ncbi:MAG: hypothetical protein ABEJ93_02575 [Candidatus Nanohalobium sp.]